MKTFLKQINLIFFVLLYLTLSHTCSSICSKHLFWSVCHLRSFWFRGPKWNSYKIGVTGQARTKISRNISVNMSDCLIFLWLNSFKLYNFCEKRSLKQFKMFANFFIHLHTYFIFTSDIIATVLLIHSIKHNATNIN